MHEPHLCSQLLYSFKSPCGKSWPNLRLNLNACQQFCRSFHKKEGRGISQRRGMRWKTTVSKSTRHVMRYAYYSYIKDSPLRSSNILHCDEFTYRQMNITLSLNLRPRMNWRIHFTRMIKNLNYHTTASKSKRKVNEWKISLFSLDDTPSLRPLLALTTTYLPPFAQA